MDFIPIGVKLGIEYVQVRQDVIYKQLKKSTLTESQKKLVSEKISQSKLSISQGQTNKVLLSSVIELSGSNEFEIFAALASSLTNKKYCAKEVATVGDSLVRTHQCSKGEWQNFANLLGKGDAGKEEILNFLSHLNISSRQMLFSSLISDKWVEEVPIQELAKLFCRSEQEVCTESQLLLARKFKENYKKAKAPAFGDAKLHQFVEALGSSLEDEVSVKKLFKLCSKTSKFTVQAEKKLKKTAAANGLIDDKRGEFQERFSHLSRVPESVAAFDVERPHTMNTREYLSNRVPAPVLKRTQIAARDKKAEFFLGSLDEMKQYYKPLELEVTLNSPTATQFYVFSDPTNKGEYKIVIGGISSETRLNHQSLQFRFAGFTKEDVLSIPVRGTFDALYAKEMQYLGESLEEFQGKKMVCVIGARYLPMLFTSKKINPHLVGESQDEESLDMIYGALKSEHHRTASLSYDAVELKQKDGSDVVLIGFRMPNGSYAGKVTDQLLKSGIDSFILVGAGGSLSEESPVGGYQSLRSSVYAGKTITLPEEIGLTPDFSGTEINSRTDVHNITVDSPLEENQDWLDHARHTAGAVDVETFHILNAIVSNNSEEGGSKARVVAGLFNSDVVGTHPLEEKIAIDNAYTHLEQFLDCANKALGIDLAVNEETT